MISLPERMTRAAIALVGGAVYETSNVALPRALRESKLYQVTIDRLLRIMIEWVGDVRDVYQDEETPVRELAARKFTGNVLEVASIFAVGFSPLWVLAAASDVMGGSKAYLRALVAELEAAGHLPRDTDVASYEDLLSRLETGSGVLADAIDIPPMSLREARASFDALRRQASDLPPAEDLATLFREMQATARQEGRSLTDVSAALGLAAAKAGVWRWATSTSSTSTATRSARFAKRACSATCAGWRRRTSRERGAISIRTRGRTPIVFCAGSIRGAVTSGHETSRKPKFDVNLGKPA